MKSEPKLYFKIFILISAAIFLSPFLVHADYTYRKATTVDLTEISASLSNFPMLVSNYPTQVWMNLPIWEPPGIQFRNTGFRVNPGMTRK
jgi:hypothetical protein